ncbi:hypothetical protein KHQ82_01910 [Mycoplasmatota bacterium]|nr:hypothetical protein KHQ82_01910 [Mycoplasmatota bacterium]
MKKILCVTTLCALAFIMIGCKQTKNEVQPEVVVYADYPEPLTDISEKIEKYDYIFIGHIVEELETLQFEGYGSSMPKTRYSVDVLMKLKGEMEDKIVIQKIGGVNEEGVLISYDSNDLPKEGSIMIIFSNKFEKYDPKDDPRNELGIYCPGPTAEAMDLLHNYDVNKNALQQADDIIEKINEIILIIGD